MQTSQVTNPANVLPSPAPASKQSEANSGSESFGQVLSREVAGRNNASEGAKAPARESGNATATRPAARTETKQANTKQADAKHTRETKTKGQEDKADQTSTDAVDAASQASEDILALVANLNQIAATSTGLEEDSASTEGQTGNATDPALALTATGGIPAAEQLAAQAAAATAVQPADPASTAAERVADTMLAAVSSKRADGAAIQLEPANVKAKAELPQAAAPDLIAKGQELLNGTSASAAAAAAPAQDFTEAVKESLSTVATAAPVQQASVHAVQSLNSNAVDKLTPRVGTPAWDQALGQKVVWMVAGEQQSASLTLNPPDLGPLQVVLNVSNSQANATFVAAQPEVRQALEAAMPKLRDMLSEAGIQLGQASVNSGTPNQQGSFDQGTASSSGFGHGTQRDDASGTDTAPRVTRVTPAAAGLGLVDTFA